MPLHISITYNVDVFSHVEILNNLLIVNVADHSNVFLFFLYLIMDYHVRVGISRSGELVCTNLRLHLLGIFVFLGCCHGIPFIGIICAIDSSVPMKHTTRANLCTGSSKGFAK